VIVVDLFGKVKQGCYAGDNLANSIYAKGRRGFVVEGGIRDLAGIARIDDYNVFCRGVDPSMNADIMLVGINVPVRIGNATVLPGDIVLGTPTGVIFIPPHLAQKVVEQSEHTRLVDQWGHMRLREQKFTPGQIDGEWAPDVKADFETWLANRGKSPWDNLWLESQE
jgi:regulator of RNase E activity RraA